MFRLDPDENLKLDEQDSIFLISNITSPKTILELPTESYVDSLHESKRYRLDLSFAFNDQDNEFDNSKLNNLDIVTVNREPKSDNELANKRYVDDSIGQGDVLRFNQTLQSYLEISVGNDTYNLTKFDEIQIADTTKIKYPNTGGDLLQNWVL